MPKLPECVYYKRRQNQEKDYILSRFKRSLTQRQERALNYLKQYIKSSELITIVDSMQEDEQADGYSSFSLRRKGRRGSAKKKLLLKSGSTCSLEGSNTQGNKDSKLSTIVKVLRQDVGTDEVEAIAKSDKLSSILQVLRDPPVSDPSQYSVDSYAFCYDDEEDERAFSTLDRRCRKSNMDGSGSASMVPSLRSSLGAGSKQRVSVYAFLDELGHTLEAEGGSGDDQLSTTTKPLSPKHHYQLHAAEEDSVQDLDDTNEVDAAMSSPSFGVASTTCTLSLCSNHLHSPADSTLQATADNIDLNHSSTCISLPVCEKGTFQQVEAPKPNGATQSTDDKKSSYWSVSRSMSVNDMLGLDCDEEVFDVPKDCEPTMTSVSTSALTCNPSVTELCSDVDSSRENMANIILRQSANQDQTSLDLGGRYSIAKPPVSDSHLDLGSPSCRQESSSAVELSCPHENSKRVYKHMSLDDVLASRHSSSKPK